LLLIRAFLFLCDRTLFSLLPAGRPRFATGACATIDVVASDAIVGHARLPAALQILTVDEAKKRALQNAVQA
jgi:hypothetical protein